MQALQALGPAGLALAVLLDLVIEPAGLFEQILLTGQQGFEQRGPRGYTDKALLRIEHRHHRQAPFSNTLPQGLQWHVGRHRLDTIQPDQIGKDAVRIGGSLLARDQTDENTALPVIA